MKLPAYPKYKTSGVDWLGDVPEHWEVKKFKLAVKLLDQKIIVDDDFPLPYIGLENIASWTGKLLSMNSDVVPSGISNSFNKNSTLFSKLRPYLAKGCNPVFDGICTTELLVLESLVIDRSILLYILLSDGFIDNVNSSTYGTMMPRANWDFIGNSLISIPPLSEQIAITTFLDRETSKVDQLIEKKHSIIEKLKEKRSALISLTVTKGLPPEVAEEYAAKFPGLDAITLAKRKFRPSGVDWLGDVPEGWKIVSLKKAIQFREGPGIMAIDFLDEGIPLLRISGIGQRMASLNGCDYLDPKLVAKRWEHFRVKVGDLLISGSASTGLCSEVDEETSGAIPYTGIIIIRPVFSVSIKDFLRWFFFSEGFLIQSDLAKTGSTIQHFGPSHLSKMSLALPPIVEQSAIVDYLYKQTAKIDRMIEKVESALAKLSEYRTSLITAAVTGKIDIRGHKP